MILKSFSAQPTLDFLRQTCYPKTMNKWSTVTRTTERKRVYHTRPGIIAKGFRINNAVEVEAIDHFNGSGTRPAPSGRIPFGGAKEWPVAKILVQFETGDDAARDTFIAKFKAFCDENLPVA